MKRFFWLIFVLYTMVLLSCHKAKNSSAESPVAKATVYIDQGDFDFAIQILEERLLFEDDSETRVVLASAYAGRAGVKVENYWDYLVGFDAFAKDHDETDFPDILPSNLVPQSLDEKSKSMLKNWNNQFKDLQRLNDKAEKIPVVEPKSRHDLLRARTILSSVSSGSSRLYRSLLTAVIVKSQFTDGTKLVNEWGEAKHDLCFPLVAELSRWLSDTLELVSDGLDDLGKAYPDQNSDYQAMRIKIQSGISTSSELQDHQKLAESLCVLQQR